MERFNAVLHKVLGFYGDQDHWDDFIGPALFAYWTAICATTGESPFFALYGRDPYLPIDRLFEVQAQPYVLDPEGHLAYHAQNMVYLWKLALEKTNEEQLRRAQLYNANSKLPNFTIGTKVWLHDPVTPVGQTKKLLHNTGDPTELHN